MRILTVVGARPQFVKAAPVSSAIAIAAEAGACIEEQVVHTGQHYDNAMSGAFFEELGLAEPRYHLAVGSGSHGAQTATMLSRLEPVIAEEAPDVVLVYGDTNSTLAGALAAAKLRVPVAHVEAGLRSFRWDMPEEVNRVVTDRVASLLFCPSKTAVANLSGEGITAGVFLAGDVMLDVLARYRASSHDDQAVLDPLGLEPGRYALATIHRAGNTDDRARWGRLLEGMARVAREMPVVFPAHPRTRLALAGARLPGGVIAVDPQPHGVTLALAAHARVVLTDSGGLQKEAYWLGVPCVTLRDETEWPETLDGGWNVLAGASPADIATAALRPRPVADPPPAYGHAGASNRIVDALVGWNGQTRPGVAA